MPLQLVQNTIAFVSLSVIGIINAIALCTLAQREYLPRNGQRSSASNGGSEENQNDTNNSISNATWVMAIATCVNLIVSIFVWNTIRGQLEEMRIEQRAWLAPKNITTLPDFVMHPNPPFRKSVIDFSFANTGKEPAIYVNRVVDYRFINNAWDKDQISKKIADILKGKSCKEIGSDPEGSTVFPNETERVYFQLSEDDAQTALGGDHWLMVGGCLIYQTMKETHWSDVCRILDPIDTDLFLDRKPGFNNLVCPTHTQAN
jgi:hypothetical protein